VRPFGYLAILVALAGTIGITAPAASAAPRNAYAVKKAQCKERASHMKFGVHLIKKDRWVKNCIAGAR